jgi:uncharacterized protein (UPF0264 family)
MIKVRGPKEALEAAQGGAHIVDAENPASMPGTTYPLNIHGIRKKLNESGFEKVLVSSSIGEKQSDRALACQAALGVATAGADVVIFGLAELPLNAAVYLGDSLVRTVKKIYPEKIVMPAVYVDTDMRRYFEPFADGIELVREIKAEGLLIDTYYKFAGKGLLDYCTHKEIAAFAGKCHAAGKQAWITGSITRSELPKLWLAGVDAIGIRDAACPLKENGTLGAVKAEHVRDLVSTMPQD